jgi:hypothetical protein
LIQKWEPSIDNAYNLFLQLALAGRAEPDNRTGHSCGLLRDSIVPSAEGREGKAKKTTLAQPLTLEQLLTAKPALNLPLLLFLFDLLQPQRQTQRAKPVFESLRL